MSESQTAAAELKQILGALVFCAKRPLSLREIRKCLQDVAASEGAETKIFGEVTPADVKAAMDELIRTTDQARVGFVVREVAGGYRLQSDPICGKWVRSLLNAGKPSRLSQPAIETLAIIAYRQPISRPEIEVVRGVNVDHVIKTLLELQLVRIAGRSELPGRPLLYGTTHTFLEHFGLKDLKELAEIEPMLLAQRQARNEAEAERAEAAKAAEEPADLEGADEAEAGVAAPATADGSDRSDEAEPADPSDESEESDAAGVAKDAGESARELESEDEDEDEEDDDEDEDEDEDDEEDEDEDEDD